jgi:Tol biopolymer transport system component
MKFVLRRSRAVMLGISFLASCVLALALRAQAPAVDRLYPNWSPDGKSILFMGGNYPHTQLYRVGPDGRHLKRISRGEGTYEDPSWSPDGSEIVYSTSRNGEWWQMIMNADGSDERPLVMTSARADDPSRAEWSPTGKLIAYRKVVVENGQPVSRLYIIHCDGSGDRPLADQEGSAPSWSRDGRRIVFYSRRDGNQELYAINSDGSGLVRLTSDPALDIMGRWSPKGDRILFMSARLGGYPKYRLFVMNADGSDPHPIGDGKGTDWYGSWSPSGDRIVFASKRGDNPRYDLYIMNADGSGVRRLLDDSALP